MVPSPGIWAIGSTTSGRRSVSPRIFYSRVILRTPVTGRAEPVGGRAGRQAVVLPGENPTGCVRKCGADTVAWRSPYWSWRRSGTGLMRLWPMTVGRPTTSSAVGRGREKGSGRRAHRPVRGMGESGGEGGGVGDGGLVSNRDMTGNTGNADNKE